jgi:hypothetical protein
MIYTIFIIILFLVFLKSVTVGSAFNFHLWYHFGKDYTKWYFDSNRTDFLKWYMKKKGVNEHDRK